MDFNNLDKTIDFIRLGGQVKRYHTKAVIKENTVGHHSFGVAWLIWLLVADGTPRPQLIMAGLAHDMAEQVTGDVSSPTKRRFPVMAEMLQTMETDELSRYNLDFESVLTFEEQRVLTLADKMDGMLYCISEMELGNRSIREVYIRYGQYIEELKPRAQEAVVYSAIRRLGVKYEGQ